MKPRGYWTKERCAEEALKYESRIDFQRESTGAYLKAMRQNWLNEICYHMREIKKKNNYWVKERCAEEALKYKTRKDFKNKCGTAYQKSHEGGWINEICSHMITFGNKIKRCIYVYEFDDNSAYVGLTYNINNRHIRHTTDNSSVVYNKIKENISYIRKQLTDYIDIEEAKEMENFYVNEYKNNKWNILNSVKTGSLGGDFLKWTKEKCQEEALKYKYRTDFQNNSRGSYLRSKRSGWLDEVCSHMKRPPSHKLKWNKEKCGEEALKYKKRSDYKKSSGSSYVAASKNKWLDEICSHMKRSYTKKLFL